MPQKEDKWKTLFADLGRPTLRGIRKCPKCATVNGTRGNSCKNKSCDVVFRGNNESSRKKPSNEACQLSNMPGCTEVCFIFLTLNHYLHVLTLKCYYYCTYRKYILFVFVIEDLIIEASFKYHVFLQRNQIIVKIWIHLLDKKQNVLLNLVKVKNKRLNKH
jgi:putative treble-clef zinc finger protein